jgi:(4S)-4-hydroxy-5-phosphonooxypentane-2,3-dione isomerase
MFTVAVLYELKPAHAETFKTAVLKNAASSLRDEPGCQQFDVSFSDDGLGCFLYEVYTDREAFAAHRTSPHFNEYDGAVKDCFVSKRIETFTRINNDR